jgi:peptidoglycan/LPS O-acetylase OafA/YrhL
MFILISIPQFIWLIYKFWGKFKIVFLFFISNIITAASFAFWLPNFLKQLGGFFMFFKINCMATGGLMAWLYFNKRHSILNFLYSKKLQLMVLTLTFGGWLFGFHLKYFNDEYYSFLFAILILNTATNEKTIISFNNKILNYLGKISYGIYVYHWIIIYLILDLIMNVKENFWLFNILL